MSRFHELFGRRSRRGDNAATEPPTLAASQPTQDVGGKPVAQKTGGKSITQKIGGKPVNAENRRQADQRRK